MVSKKTNVDKNKLVDSEDYLEQLREVYSNQEQFKTQFIGDWIDRSPALKEINKPPPFLPFSEIVIGKQYTLFFTTVKEEIIQEVGHQKIIIKHYDFSTNDVTVLDIAMCMPGPGSRDLFDEQVKMVVFNSKPLNDHFKDSLISVAPVKIERLRSAYDTYVYNGSKGNIGWGLRYKT